MAAYEKATDTFRQFGGEPLPDGVSIDDALADGVFVEGDWLVYEDGELVGRITSEQGALWEVYTEGILPFEFVGKFAELSEAKEAIEAAIKRHLNEDLGRE